MKFGLMSLTRFFHQDAPSANIPQAQVTNIETRSDYSALVTATQTADKGHDKAVALLDLLSRMRRDKKDFYDVFRQQECPALQQELCSNNPLVNICHDGDDNKYYYPDPLSRDIVSGEDFITAHKAWRHTLLRVSQFAVSGVLDKNYTPRLVHE